MDERVSVTSSTSPLLWNVVLFSRLLRRLGVPVPASAVADLIRALDSIDIGHGADFRNTARCILIHRNADLALFERAFDAFWVSARTGNARGRAAGRRFGEELTVNGNGAGQSQQEGGIVTTHSSSKAASQPRSQGEARRSRLATYCWDEELRTKDFDTFSDTELADAERFLAEVDWTLTERRSRRLRAKRHGPHLDFRSSLRGSVRNGGELVELARRGSRTKRRSLVLLCDISGSMERYTRLLLHFLHSVQRGAQSAEVFVFATRLTRITPALRHRDPDSAIAAASTEVRDWSGGTRIGEALGTFNREWARRVLGCGAIVLIISDGWDRGDPDLLAAEMQRLQRASYRMIWLNPLVGGPHFRPVTQGMRAALPYVDDFLPAHNLESLAHLASLLNDVQEVRPARSQRARLTLATPEGEDHILPASSALVVVEWWS
ncbi:MAG TPA: VWA domain-containing protein [Chloroflexota bacterium]